MKENTKKALYESIMQKVSQQVVEMLNESKQLNEAYNSTKISRFMNLAKEKSNDSDETYYIFFAQKPCSLKSNPKALVLKYETYACYKFRNNGELWKEYSYKVNGCGGLSDALDLKYISDISDEECKGDLLINPTKNQIKCGTNDFVLICCPKTSIKYKTNKIDNTYYSSIVFENPQTIDGLLVISSDGMKKTREPELRQAQRRFDKGYSSYGPRSEAKNIDYIIKNRKRILDTYGEYADEISKKLKEIAILAGKGIRNIGENNSMHRYKNDKKLEMRIYAKLIDALYENIGVIDMYYD